MPETIYSRKQAAEYIQVSIVTIDRAIANKKISCYRVGRCIKFSQKHLDDFLASCEQKAKTKQQ